MPIEVGSANDLAAAFEKITSENAKALMVIAGALTYTLEAQIAELALAHHLPSCHAFKETVAAGGLVSLGPDLFEMAKQGAEYVDRIVRGASPADLPVQQPSRYEMQINLKTANALGLSLSPAILARADKVID